MVNISTNTNNSINVSGRGNANVNVNSKTKGDVNADTNGNSQRAKSWAVGQGLIDNEDYSAKYYAQEAKKSEKIASEAITNIDAVKDSAIEEMEEAKDAKIAEINATASDFEDDLTDLTERAETSARSAANSAEYIVNHAPTLTVTQTTAGATITAVDMQGTTTANIYNGNKGEKGDKGDKGEKGDRGEQGIQGEKGETGAQGAQGVKGDTGATGADGYSPSATVVKDGNKATISITDKDGTTTAEIYDGSGGGVAPSNMVTTDTAQDISGRKTFLGEKAIYFKQQAASNKLGFTLYNPSNTELAALEYRPNTISGASLLALNCPQTTGGYVGFRYWGTPAVNIVAPRVATAGNYFIPTHITNGNTTVTASNTGTVNISTLLPDVSNFVTNTSLATTLNDYQPLLESSTNIKTINNQSLLGSGNIDTRETYTAVFDESTFTDVQNAYNSGKIIKCHFMRTGFVTCYLVFYDGDYFVFMGEARYREVDNIQYIFLRLDSNDNWIYWQKENADTTLSNVSSIDSNSAVATALDGKVSKSGDTMTGDLTIEQAGLHTLWTDTDSTVTPSSQISHDAITFRDVNNVGMTYMGFKRNTDGSYLSTLTTRKKDGTGWATFEIGYDANGDSYCNFPNTKRVDGQWISKIVELVSNVSMNNTTKTISLNNYLPNDGNKYEVLFVVIGRTGTTSGNYMILFLNSGIAGGNVEINRAITRSSSYSNAGGNVILPCKYGQNVTLQVDSNATCTNIYVTARAYRRVGTNI